MALPWHAKSAPAVLRPATFAPSILASAKLAPPPKFELTRLAFLKSAPEKLS